MKKIFLIVLCIVVFIQILLYEPPRKIWNETHSKFIYVYSKYAKDDLGINSKKMYLYFSTTYKYYEVLFPNKDYLRIANSEDCLISYYWEGETISISTNCILDAVDNLNSNNEIIFLGDNDINVQGLKYYNH